MNLQQDNVSELMATLAEREARIAFLEKELIDFKLQLACAKTNEDLLRHELTNALAPKHHTNNPADLDHHHSVIMDTKSSDSDEEDVVCKKKDRSKPNTKKVVTRRNRSSAKLLKPASCASFWKDRDNLSVSSSNTPSIVFSRRGRDASCSSGIAIMFGHVKISSSKSSLGRKIIHKKTPSTSRHRRRATTSSEGSTQNESWDFSAVAGPKKNMFL